MRTTVTLDDDVAAAVAARRSATHGGLSEAVNDLIRAGLRAERASRTPFTQATHPLGLQVDVSSVADALEALDGPRA